MNNPEASSAAAVGQSVQASRDFAPEDPRRGSFQRPGQDVGFGVRRGHSDGEILQAWHNVSNSMSAGQGSGSSLHRVPSVELPTQNSTPNRPPPPARRESWHEHSRNNTEGSDNLQVFLNNLGTQDDPRSHRARQQAIALMHEQRKRMMQQEIQARRRATTSMMSPPNHQAVGMRRDRPQTGDNRRANRASYPGIVIPQYPPPRPAQYYSNQGGVQQRQEHILPRWQPDSEVSSCPICHHPFSFFFRKHHCRKCGRVVCAQCSPHRITIPRQFIVHPPAEDGIFGTDASGDSDEGNAVAALSPTGLPNSALGGGEEVRLCNPCVPDPNPLPPPPYHSPQNNRYSALPRQDPPSWQGPGWPPSPLAQDANFVSPRRSVHTDTMERQANAAAIRRSELNTQTPLRHPHARQSSQIVQGNPYRPTPPSPHGSMQDNRSAFLIEPRQHHSRSRHRATASLSAFPPRYSSVSMLDVTTPLPPRGPPVPHQHSQEGPSRPPRPEEPWCRTPKRQIPEEDECPICHLELPPKGPNGEETEREAHVSTCIEEHFSTSRPRTQSLSQPQPRAAIAAAVVASAATPAQAGLTQEGSAAMIAGPSTPRRRTTGMVVYNATEKDCVGEDGETQECVICFEDFEVGAEMGRLECLCKYHKACIRAWWDTKGVGFCPVHQDGLA